MFALSKDASAPAKFATNIASGGFAGSLSLAFVYSLDYARTRLANDAKGKFYERTTKVVLETFYFSKNLTFRFRQGRQETVQRLDRCLPKDPFF